MFQYTAFAFGVLADINAFYYYTGNSVYLSHPLAESYPPQVLG